MSGSMGCSANWKRALSISSQAQPRGPPSSAGKASGVPGERPLPFGLSPHVPSTHWHLFFKFLLHSSRPQVPQWPGLPPCPFIAAARTFQIPLQAYCPIPLARLPLDPGSLLHAPFALLCPDPGHASRSPGAAGDSLCGHAGESDPLRRDPGYLSMNPGQRLYQKQPHLVLYCPGGRRHGGTSGLQQQRCPRLASVRPMPPQAWLHSWPSLLQPHVPRFFSPAPQGSQPPGTRPPLPGCLT